MFWGSKPTHCVLHIWLGSIWYVWTPSYAVDVWIWMHPFIFHSWGQILENWRHGEVQVMSKGHGWGCKSSHSTSHIQIWSIWSVWAPPCAVDGHLGAPLHSIAMQVWVIFGKLGVWLSLSDVVRLWERLCTTPLCILHSYWMYMKCLSTSICSGWAHGFTLS